MTHSPSSSSQRSTPSTPAAPGASARHRRWLGGVIVVFWLLVMGWWLSGQLGRTASLPAGGIAAPSDSWYGLYLGDVTPDQLATAERQQIGRLHVVQEPEERSGEGGRPEEGQRTELTAELALTLFGEATQLQLDGQLWRALDGEPVELRFALTSRGQSTNARARVAEGRLRGTVETGGEETPLDFPVDGDLLLAGGFGASLQLPVPAVGEEVRLDSFDPMTLGRGEARLRALRVEMVEIDDEQVEATVVEVTTAGLSSTAWVSANGDVLRATTPLGLTLERIAAPVEGDVEIASGPDGSLLELTAIRPTGPPEGQRVERGMRHLKLRLRGAAEALAAIPGDRVQRRAADGREGVVLDITVPNIPVSSPPNGESTAAAVDPEPAWLAAAPFVQSDHPRIREQAARILADAGVSDADPWTRARALADWVYAALDKRAVLSVPSALDVLATREGDCNEHTVLYTALARASGIPSRIAIGLVWSDEAPGLEGEGGFYYHAWPEVLTADGWLWLDPTLGQPLADATHVKLLNGGIETWTRLLPHLGRLQIDVLEAELPETTP